MMIRKVYQQIYYFSQIKVPIVDVSSFLKGKSSSLQDCKTVAQALHNSGCLIIKDPRVNQKDNDPFLDMMEKYFQTRSKLFYAGQPVPEIYPQYHYQVGATPEFTQKARDNSHVAAQFTKENATCTTFPPPFDAKWRYFWNIGESAQDSVQNQSPADFPQFAAVMDKWGNHMLDGCITVAEMAAIGMGLQKTLFSSLMKKGPHKLAPTGSDLMKYKVGTIFAGFHYDFNFLTIHGKSRYPGLFAWLRTGQKFTVQVPEGHLLLQSGKQFEWMTGGYITSGFHEVIYTEKVEQNKRKTIEAGGIPWRVSSTLFSHIRGDVVLKPQGKFYSPQASKLYPDLLAREHAMQELEAINLRVQ